MAESPGEANTTGRIAAMTKVPAGYLSKVLQNLARAGLVVSQRGLGGGFTLTKPSDEMTIYEIVQAVDPLPRIRSCPLKLKEHAKELCALHRRLDDATATVEKCFRETTVRELLATKSDRPTFGMRARSRKAKSAKSSKI